MSREIIVSKLGTSLNAHRETGLHTDQIRGRVADITANHPRKSHIFVVSGAREMGMFQARMLFSVEKFRRLTDKQFAGMGGIVLFHAYEQACEAVGMASASLAISDHLLRGKADPETLEERKSLIDFAHENADENIASIFNEADPINDKELMRQVYGSKYEIDNDQLAAYTAIDVGAIALDLWKEKGGLRDDDGEYIPLVDNRNVAKVEAMLSTRSNGDSGRGGPATTLQAAVLASQAGIETRIAGVNEGMTGVNVTQVMVG